MTIRFAGARAEATSVIGAWRCRSAPLCAVNDNTWEPLGDTVVGAALRHFARHGLSAAEHAATHAASALCAGDRDGGLTWLAVCRQFDRRMADALAVRHESPAS
jgi:hypothetical protein